MINELFNPLCPNMLATTLYDLAPWIMIAITLWGIARLFNKNNSNNDSEINDEQELEQTDSNSCSSEYENENYDDEDE